jgi:cytochrome P450
MLWILILIFTILFYVYIYHVLSLSHLKSSNIFLLAIIKIFSTSSADISENNNNDEEYALRKKDYQNYRRAKYGGGASQFGPLILTNLETVKAVNIKDFNIFSDRHLRLDHAYSEVMNNMLSFQTGDDWKRLKGILTQAFSTRRLRRIHNSFNVSGNKLVEFLRNQMKNTVSGDFEIVGPVNKYLLDLISTSVFGIDSEIYSETTSLFEIFTKEIQDTMIRHREAKLVPGLLQICNCLRINLIRPNPKAVQFFKNIIDTSIQTRKFDGEKRDDVLQLLLEAQSSNEREHGFEHDSEAHQLKSSGAWSDNQLSNDMLLSQAFMFFFAGTEGPATLMVYGLYELALNPEIQDKLFNEVKTAMDDSEDQCLEYDTVNELPYLDMFVSEVLRMYSSGVTARRCGDQYKVPGTDILLQPGANVHTPLYGIHHDEEYYENPFKFDPENFSIAARDTRKPTAYIPFGIGPRSCIAKGFGLIQGKTVISQLVYNFKVQASSRTEIPPVGSIKSMFLPINGLWLKLEDRILN